MLNDKVLGFDEVRAASRPGLHSKLGKPFLVLEITDDVFEISVSHLKKNGY